MYDIARFSLGDMARCSADLRHLGRGAGSMEEVANEIVRYLYDCMLDRETGTNCFALVRLFKTHPYVHLEPDLQEFARSALGREPQRSGMRCLTLLATVGSKPEWTSRALSLGHKAIPLESEQVVRAFPMISSLIQQFGLDVAQVIDPRPGMLLDLEQKTYNVFHVATALGNEYVVAQDEFVIPERIKSCLGFGGVLPSGDLFAVVMFSRVQISAEVASMFRTIALSVKLALLPFESSVFATAVRGGR